MKLGTSSKIDHSPPFQNEMNGLLGEPHTEWHICKAIRACAFNVKSRPNKTGPNQPNQTTENKKKLPCNKWVYWSPFFSAICHLLYAHQRAQINANPMWSKSTDVHNANFLLFIIVCCVFFFLFFLHHSKIGFVLFI